MTPSWVGRTIDHYRITEKIGQGGSGQVFRGIDLQLDRPVAIKVLRAELATDPDLAERFRCEAQTLARLNHPNIATLYRLLWEGDLRVMVMEYVEGRTLDQVLVARGPLPPELIMPLLRQVLDGVEHAHHQGIIHRDIKGSNVMATAAGLVKVMDFGIARALGSSGVTQDGRPVGTPEYMSPEQIRGEAVDARSDIYSLGVLLYKLLRGRVPFSGKSQFETMRAHLDASPQRLSGLTVGLEPGLRSVVETALAQDPGVRFADVGALRAALEVAVPAPGFLPGDELARALGIDEPTLPPVSEELGTLDGDTAEVHADVTPDAATLPAALEAAGESAGGAEAGPTRILPDDPSEGGWTPRCLGKRLPRVWRQNPRAARRGGIALLAAGVLAALGLGIVRPGMQGSDPSALAAVSSFPVAAPILPLPDVPEREPVAPEVPPPEEVAAERRQAPADAPPRRARPRAARAPSGRPVADARDPADSRSPAAEARAPVSLPAAPAPGGDGWVIRR